MNNMHVPKFECYFPSEKDLKIKQYVFYKTLEKKLNNGAYLDVQGNISYVFVYLYKIFSKWDKKGFEELNKYLIYLSELYKHEEKLSQYCLFWAYDCLLGLKRYEEYLEKTEPTQMFNKSRFPYNNTRLNVQKHLGGKANPIDILILLSGRKTKVTSDNQGLYKENIIKIFTQYSKENGNWFKILEEFNDDYRGIYLDEEYSLVDGVFGYLEFKTTCFYNVKNDLIEIIRNLSKEAENSTRKTLGIPNIGEKWISETMLFKKLETEFFSTKVIQHGHPSWLGRQHFDIWFPYWDIAVEYHGKQHFKPIEFFGGKKTFKENIERDKRKINLAKKHGVQLFIVTEDDNQYKLIQEIHKRKKERKKERKKIFIPKYLENFCFSL